MVNWLYNIKSTVFIKQFMAWTSHRILTVHFTFKTLQLTHQGDNEQSCLQMFEYSFHPISFKNDKVTSVECQVMTVAKITFQPVMTVQCNLVLLFFWQCKFWKLHLALARGSHYKHFILLEVAWHHYWQSSIEAFLVSKSFKRFQPFWPMSHLLS